MHEWGEGGGLPYEVHRRPGFAVGGVGGGDAVNLLEQPSHVVGQDAHSLHAFRVLG